MLPLVSIVRHVPGRHLRLWSGLRRRRGRGDDHRHVARRLSGSFSAAVVAAGAATDILIPPSVAFIIYSVLVPGASVPALFAAGMVPGILAGFALIIPAVWLSRKHKMGGLEAHLPRPPFWQSLREASWAWPRRC